ncbi:hypothetical protein U9M48_040153 [Paspalum notatum var. saurae]|uniref:Uncharacterized protein n=1 Tax=Paspalum notatum var. saurae TaxID=547442 RepID=A0AAQ3XFA6_PASNO
MEPAGEGSARATCSLCVRTAPASLLKALHGTKPLALGRPSRGSHTQHADERAPPSGRPMSISDWRGRLEANGDPWCYLPCQWELAMWCAAWAFPARRWS